MAREAPAVTQDGRHNADSRSASAPAARPVAGDLKERVCVVLVDKLAGFLQAQDSAIDPGRPLAEYGIDSTDLLTLVFEIEEQFDCRFPAETFFDVETLDDLAARIAASLVEQGLSVPGPPRVASP
jgi:acyl carrier protein